MTDRQPAAPRPCDRGARLGLPRDPSKASRLAYTEILPSEGRHDSTAFLQRALDWLGRHGVTVERVMTDNGSACLSKLFASALNRASLCHVRTRPCTPRTNGKAERFIQTAVRE